MYEVKKTAIEFAKFSRKTHTSSGDHRKKSSGKRGEGHHRRAKRVRDATESPSQHKESSDKGDDGTDVSGRGSKRRRYAKWTEKCLNPKCDGIHPLYKCNITSEEEKTKLLDEYRQRKKKLSVLRKTHPSRGSETHTSRELKSHTSSGPKTHTSQDQKRHNSGCRYKAILGEVLEMRALGDSSFDVTAMDMDNTKSLQDAGINFHVPKFDQRVELFPALQFKDVI